MILKVLTLRLFKNFPLTILQFPIKEYHKFLKLYLSNFNIRHCSNFGKNSDVSLLDTVNVQKYLNFITSESSHNFQTEELQEVIQLIRNKKSLEAELKALEDMSSEDDKDMAKLIESEKKQYEESIEEIKKEILVSILPHNNENDNRNVELQILSGIGGDESKLFSKELLQMYINYAEYKDWEHSADFENNTLQINGDFVFGHLKHEAGVHRVQRVPATEKSGRIHTSTCSVVVLPMPKLHEIQIKEKDLTVERIKSSGPGGQNVNKRQSCIRVKHIPSGIVIENQTSRFQYENLKEAILRLRTILFNKEQEKVLSERYSMRKSQAGSNDYADKIRTYHYSHNRVTDHRLGYTCSNLLGFLMGKKELDVVIRKLNELSRKDELLFYIESILNSVEYKNFEKKTKLGD